MVMKMTILKMIEIDIVDLIRGNTADKSTSRKRQKHPIKVEPQSVTDKILSKR